MFDISLESVSYAGKDLFTKLAEMVHFLRLDGTYSTNAIKQTLFNDIVKRHTGLNVTLSIMNFGDTINAFASLPDLNRNHVFYKLYGGMSLSGSEGTRLIEMQANRGKATVNLANSTVGGLYSEIPLDICVFLGLFRNKSFSDNEIASIILHELGHHFTYFQYINTVGFGGLITTIAAKEIVGASTKEERKDKILLAEKIMGLDKVVDIKDDTDLNVSGVQVVLFSNYLAKMYSATGTVQYDQRNCEQLADQFATKHGAGRDLVTAMDKMDRFYDHTSKRSTFAFIAVETCKLLMYILTLASITFIPIGLIALIIAQPSGYKDYDDPKARAVFIRRQLIASIKDVKATKGLDQKILDGLIEDLEVVDGVIENMNDYRTLVQLFWSSVPGPGKSLRQQEEAAKQLESLLYNDLEYQATRFQLLTK